MITICPRVGRWIGGCKLESRHDRIPPEPALDPVLGYLFYQSASEIEALTKLIYVRDVCTRCGKVVERGGK